MKLRGLLFAMVLLIGTDLMVAQPLEVDSTHPPIHLSLLQAIRQTLAREPNILLQEQQVNVAKGALQAAAGQFDLSLDSGVSRGVTRLPRTEQDRVYSQIYPNILENITEITSYRLGLNKPFRNGVSISPGLQVDRTADNLTQQRAVNRANVNLVITVPLLKGAGRATVDAPERAARINYEAAQLDFEQVIATRILNTVSAYWNCRAAQQKAAILVASTDRSRRLVEAVGELVRIGELPAAETNQVQADLAQRQANQIAGDLSLVQARQNLGLAVGLSARELAGAPLPADDFPTNFLVEGLPRPDEPGLIERGLHRRADYQSALKAQRATEILLAAARHNLKPRLDLNLQAGYSGLDEGSQFRRLYGALDPYGVSGPNAFGSLSLQWPFANQSARGLFAQRQAQFQQSQIKAQDLARSITSGIRLAFSDLEHSRDQLRQATNSANYYRLAIAAEEAKLHLGTSSVIDVLTIADRLSAALLNEADAQAALANAVVRLRFELGLLVSPGAERQMTLSEEHLRSAPAPAELVTQRPKS